MASYRLHRICVENYDRKRGAEDMWPSRRVHLGTASYRRQRVVCTDRMPLPAIEPLEQHMQGRLSTSSVHYSHSPLALLHSLLLLLPGRLAKKLDHLAGDLVLRSVTVHPLITLSQIAQAILVNEKHRKVSSRFLQIQQGHGRL